MRSAIRTTCLFFLLALPGHAQEAPEHASAIAERQAVKAQAFMIATANPLATEAGRDVLAAGGSAADAAIAAQMVLNLVEPQSSGIGGGGFVLYWDAALDQLASFDGRETAPAAAMPAYWLDDAGAPLEFWDAVVGGRSVGGAGHAEADGDAARALRPAAVGRALPARDRARRGRLPDLAATGRGDRRGCQAPARRLPGRPRALLLHQDGSPKAAGEILTQPGPRPRPCG